MTDHRFKAACAWADSDHPIANMLRDASERLDRSPPDVAGAKVSLHGARLAIGSVYADGSVRDTRQPTTTGLAAQIDSAGEARR